MMYVENNLLDVTKFFCSAKIFNTLVTGGVEEEDLFGEHDAGASTECEIPAQVTPADILSQNVCLISK